MDDRFDLMLASHELFDGEGVDYVDDSFHVFGNDGSHVLGESIDTGTALPPDILSALAVASDHLPIVAEFQILPSFEPGDADRDFDFDQFDLILLHQAGKYRTGETATWREGDWNGDRLFDQRDLIPALATGNYWGGVRTLRIMRLSNRFPSQTHCRCLLLEF